MKRILIILNLICVQWMVFAQSESDFKNFVNLFPLVKYPYTASDDFRRMTRVDAVIRTIDASFYEKFVSGQGIKPVALGCFLEDFVAYRSYIQLPATDSVYLLVLVPEMNNPACGGGSLLVTYSRFNHQLQDTLWISFNGGIELSRTSDQQIICSIDIESVLTGDTIFLERKHTYVVRIGDLSSSFRSFIVKISTYNYKYVMSVGGRFKQISASRKDEILDEELVKLLSDIPR